MFSLQNKKREISSWCIHYLLKKIADKLKEDKPIDQQAVVLNDPYTVLLLWHINQLFNLKDDWAEDKVIDWYSQFVGKEYFAFYDLESKLAKSFEFKNETNLKYGEPVLTPQIILEKDHTLPNVSLDYWTLSGQLY